MSTGEHLPSPNEPFLTFRRFVFAGLADLIEHLLISNAQHVRMANDFGIKKIMRNTLALQQSIRTISDNEEHVEFERSKRYYSLFFLTPQVRSLFCMLHGKLLILN